MSAGREGARSMDRPAVARDLLDAAPGPGEREEWARLYAQPPPRAAASPARAFVFRVGAEWLALPAECLAEAAEPRAIRTIPHRREGALAGLVNLDGELVPCVRLDRILDIEASRADEPARRILVVDTKGGRIAFLADQVHGPLAYDAATTGAAPSRPACVRSLIDWAGKPVGLLDRAALWPRLERSLA